MSKSKSLFEIQTHFFNAITNKSILAGSIDFISTKPPITNQQRLEIYQNAYKLRLTESIKDDFASVAEKLSTEEFDALVDAFIAANTSHTKNLAEYSEQFVTYLLVRNSTLAEYAIIDWLYILSQQAADAPLSMVANAEYIQSNEPFTVQLYPATFFENYNGTIYVSYRNHNHEIKSEIFSNKYEILFKKLRNPHKLSQLELLFNKQNFSETEMSQIFSSWVEKQIIFCQRSLE